ncbi:MAG: hypothetical protein HC892_10040 [Saprospiraceae bacterium]|nr:hypothetical protein [Saprospiraceae bacterium]
MTYDYNSTDGNYQESDEPHYEKDDKVKIIAINFMRMKHSEIDDFIHDAEIDLSEFDDLKYLNKEFKKLFL